MMTAGEMRYKLNELRMMLNDGEHTEEQGILAEIIKELDKAESAKTDTDKPESDLISRTQAINDYAQCFADEYGMDCGEMFIGVLHQCPTFPDSAENKGEWIPVVERLPEIHQYVLLSLRSLDIEVGFRAETEPYFYCHGADGCYIEPQNVLAWQPLPKPYKENEA